MKRIPGVLTAPAPLASAPARDSPANGDLPARGVSVSVSGTHAFTSLNDAGNYLSRAAGGSAPDDPVPLPAAVSGAGYWPDLLEAIHTAKKYVALDLSGSAIAGTGAEMDPGVNSAGKQYVVSLVLPDAAESITDPSFFRSFACLKEVSGANIKTIGGGAFRGCTCLSAVSFPSAASVGRYAFRGCTGLSSASFPAATSIGNGAFRGCTCLSSASFPSAASIGYEAFWGCTGLSSASFPAATSIGKYAFRGCTCLSSASFPSAASIGSNAFRNCTGLSSADFPAATFIGHEALGYTGGTALTVTLGSTPPMVGFWMFYGVTVPKTVTVRVPSGEAAWNGIIGGSPYNETGPYTDNWGNSFRGGGWDGGAMTGSGWINSNISLTIEAC